MVEELEVIFDYEGDDGRRASVSVDRRNRLHVNGRPVVTESKLTLDWWVTAAALVTAVATLTLALVEVGRIAGFWN